jgi:hypothetical protein
MTNMNDKIKAALEAARTNPHQRLLWPEATSFGELFKEARRIDDLSKYKSTEAHVFDVGDPYREGIRGKAAISSFCSVRGRGDRWSYDLKPTEKTVELVRENMLLMPDYRISFEINVYKDGTALVSAQYDQICGSRWFTFIDRSTLP